jgi:hypothetical protein
MRAELWSARRCMGCSMPTIDTVTDPWNFTCARVHTPPKWFYRCMNLARTDSGQSVRWLATAAQACYVVTGADVR